MHKRIPVPEAAVMQALADEGLTCYLMGDRLGVSHNTAARWLRHHGIKTIRGGKQVRRQAGSDMRPLVGSASNPFGL